MPLARSGHYSSVPRLRRSDCSGPGYRRVRHGRGFRYVDQNGERLESPEARERIGELAIPPAWEEVWICPDPFGHLQATGIDAAGRKQYLYHARWRERRDRQKFDTMLQFAAQLPTLRKRIKRDLRADGLARDRVMACAARLLDVGFFRVGSESYAEDNGSYGLATLLKRHASISNGAVVFDYPAKSGQRRVQAIVDPTVQDVLRALKRRRGGGPELLAYRNGRGWRDVRSEDINAYLKETLGGDYSAKDFRTWNATVLAAVRIAIHGSERAPKRAIAATVADVAEYLGNTPTVCRKSYIDPRVFDRYRSGWTIAEVLGAKDPGRDIVEDRGRRAIEVAVLDLLG
jgi:DNA topoisomerase-1